MARNGQRQGAVVHAGLIFVFMQGFGCRDQDPALLTRAGVTLAIVAIAAATTALNRAGDSSAFVGRPGPRFLYDSSVCSDSRRDRDRDRRSRSPPRDRGAKGTPEPVIRSEDDIRVCPLAVVSLNSWQVAGIRALQIDYEGPNKSDLYRAVIDFPAKASVPFHIFFFCGTANRHPPPEYDTVFFAFAGSSATYRCIGM